MQRIAFFIFTFSIVTICLSQRKNDIYLWPNKVPNENSPKYESKKVKDGAKVTEVTNPKLITFKPEKEKSNGAGIIICPGGGYGILCIQKEGYDVAEWLTSLGYTAFVLEYRVPKKQEGALQDIQRAIRIIRKKAKKWNINPSKVGVLGFSAGGSLCARASTRYLDKTYPMIDKIDNISCKPDFSILIYPAYLDRGPNKTLTPELVLNKDTPPMFIFCTFDDIHCKSSIVMADALREHKVSTELHIIPSGGHGYGMRTGNIAGKTWPTLLKPWLNNKINE